MQRMIGVDRGDVPTATEEIETEGGIEETKRNTNNTKKAFSNAIKHNMNLLY